MLHIWESITETHSPYEYVSRSRSELGWVFISCHPPGEWENIWEKEKLYKDSLEKKLYWKFPLIWYGKSDLTMIEQKMSLPPNSLKKISIGENVSEANQIHLEDMTFAIISWSAYDIRENLSFKDRLFELIRIIYEHKVPLLGICFWHQAISAALIGDHMIEDLKEIQVWAHNIYLLKDYIYWDWTSFNVTSFNKQIVKDVTEDSLPEWASILAKDRKGSIQAISRGEKSLWIQFHPEQQNGFLLQTEIFKDYLYKHWYDDAKIFQLQKDILDKLKETNDNGEIVLKDFLSKAMTR